MSETESDPFVLLQEIKKEREKRRRENGPFVQTPN
jgi:hypothetical protein